MLGRVCLVFLATLPRLVSALAATDLAAWLESLVIEIPSGLSFPLPAVGDFVIERGECKGLQIGQLNPIDNSSNRDLVLGIRVYDIGVSCTLQGNQNGSLSIDLTVVNSTATVAFRMQPWHPPQTPQLALPLGGLETMLCELQLQVSHAQFSGTAPVVDLARSVPPATLLELMGQFVQEPVCNIVRSMINVNATAALIQGQKLIAPLLLPPQAVLEPKVVAPTLHLGSYAPVQVLTALVNMQFPKFAVKHLSAIQLPIYKEVFGNADVSLSIDEVSMATQTQKGAPGLALSAGDHELGLHADLSKMRSSVVLGINVTLPNQTAFATQVAVDIGLLHADLSVNVFLNEHELRLKAEEGNLGQLGCYLDCARSSVDPANASLALAETKVALQSGTRVQWIGSVSWFESDAQLLVNTVLEEAQRSFLPAIQTLLRSGLAMRLPTLNRLIWKLLESKPPCSKSDATLFHVLWISSLTFAGLAIVAGVFAAFSETVRKAKAGSARTGTAPSNAPSTCAEVQGEVEEDSVVSTTTMDSNASSVATDASVCLAMQPHVPAWLGISLPLALISVTFLFLYACLAPGALVNIKTTAGDSVETLGPLLSLSLINTVVHSWMAGAYFIAILALLMSGVWPFVKLALLNVAWLTPPRMLSPSNRGHILRVLDQAGKYALMDAWFLVLSAAAFAMKWRSGDMELKVEVTPTAAFYAFVLATAVSLVLGHVVSEFHRCGLRREKRFLTAMEFGISFNPSKTAKWSVYQPLSSFVSGPMRWAMAGMALFTLAIAAIAAFSVSFSFIVGGLPADLLEYRGIRYSMVSVATSLPSAGAGSGLVAVELLFLLVTVILPITLPAILLVLWLVPLPGRTQDILLYMAHIMDCWASMEVVALTLTVEAVELGHLADFVIASNGMDQVCGLVEQITNQQCFSLALTLHSGFFTVIAAGLTMLIVPKLMHRMCRMAVEIRNTGIAHQQSAKTRGQSSSGNMASQEVADRGAVVV